MKTIQELITEAASSMIFEEIQKTKILDITISPKEDSSNIYSIRVPKLFLEEFARLAIENHKTISPTFSTTFSIPNYVGSYSIGGKTGLQIHFTKKPKWLHRKMMKLCLGWEWIDN
jgi:hypothetical protein